MYLFYTFIVLGQRQPHRRQQPPGRTAVASAEQLQTNINT